MGASSYKKYSKIGPFFCRQGGDSACLADWRPTPGKNKIGQQHRLFN
jgi:hypothetical protein